MGSSPRKEQVHKLHVRAQYTELCEGDMKMKGAIIGDIVGSVYEFHNRKSKEFPFFSEKGSFTDDTVMTCAVAKGLMDSKEDFSDLSEKTIAAMQEIGQQFPNCGYGARFIHWMFSDNPQPYNSCGNGSAMRISPSETSYSCWKASQSGFLR